MSGAFILQYAKLRMLELYYNFVTKLCYVNKFEELELDRDSLPLALAEKELGDCTRPEIRPEWQRLRSIDCFDRVTADALAIFFSQRYCVKPKQHINREPGLLNESSDEWRCYVSVVIHTVAMNLPLIGLKSPVKVSPSVYWNRMATDHWKSVVEC